MIEEVEHIADGPPKTLLSRLPAAKRVCARELLFRGSRTLRESN